MLNCTFHDINKSTGQTLFSLTVALRPVRPPICVIHDVFADGRTKGASAMQRFFLCLLGGVVWLLAARTAVPACTTFQFDDDGRISVGTNYDWGVPDGLVIINPRGLAKTAMPSYRDHSEVGRPAKWTSRYGSVTFNQYGREMPFGGMNEAGLVIGTMGRFSRNKFPAPDNRPSIYMQQWLQYQLDNHARMDAVIRSEARLRIRPKPGVHIHFLVSDRDGHCAVIEYIDGRQVVHAGPTLPDRVLINSTYDESLE
jgi:choloylglycine hydrolase